MGERRRREFSPEFKRDAVNLVRLTGLPLAQIARELGVGESRLSYWVVEDREQRAASDPSTVRGVLLDRAYFPLSPYLTLGGQGK